MYLIRFDYRKQLALPITASTTWLSVHACTKNTTERNCTEELAAHYQRTAPRTDGPFTTHAHHTINNANQPLIITGWLSYSAM